MEIYGWRAVVREQAELDPVQLRPIPTWEYIDSRKIVAAMQECALTRAFAAAQRAGKLQRTDLLQVEFVTPQGQHVQATEKTRGAVRQFFRDHRELHPFGLNQHMAEVGKLLVGTRPVAEMLTALWSKSFAEDVDTNRWLKLCQIACQPGRLLGNEREGIEPVKPWACWAYVDQKRPEEDGVILVDPDFWPYLVEAYSTEQDPLPHTTTLIKVNATEPDVAIKGVLQRADRRYWQEVQERSGRSDFQVLLCGHALKYNRRWEVGARVGIDQSLFAYHTDSNQVRGTTVNVSKQLMTRSGMDTEHFVQTVAAPQMELLEGLMQFEDEKVLRAIGALSTRDLALDDGGRERPRSQGELEIASAIKRRITQHCLPASHPVNALQIWRLGLVHIRQRLNRLPVPRAFHGMGGISHVARGVVLVPRAVYKQWMRTHASNEAYLFRMPYLGSYCGIFVHITPAATDTLLVNWQDAAQLEGDFDGDQYFLIPTTGLRGVEAGEKPFRPQKGEKAEVPLENNALLNAMLTLATNKVGIGPRDHLLCVAFDYLARARHGGTLREINHWEQVVSRLQVWVQQAVEGLKHDSEGILTETEVRKMFPDPQPHVYTRLFSNRAFRELHLESTRLNPGYIEQVRKAVALGHTWHPLHPIFARIATMEFGKIISVIPYWQAIREERPRFLKVTCHRGLYRRLRELKREYKRLIRQWDGGRNRNVNFGQDVLGPVREQWNTLLAEVPSHDGQPHQGALWDLHLMLAQVAYEPQPNWRLRHLLDHWHHRCRRAPHYYHEHLRTAGTLRGHVPQDTKVQLQGYAHVARGGQTLTVHRWLPESGSLFHHLADAETARRLFHSVLPMVSADELVREILGFIREACSD